ncbi:hypothetical protein [Nocardioides rubriscoriae]|uniref:hypothetical protein n=1 Tax=Nocardioides rubriscoriae TaxID=642762 RepID=UPI0011DF3D5A|nr:hypothetical protein [Nocardioides rubriscoriae]
MVTYSLVGCGDDTVDTGDFVQDTMNEYVTSLPQATEDCGTLRDWVADARDESVPEDDQLASAWEGVIGAADDYAAICESGDPTDKASGLFGINDALEELESRVAQL